MKKVLFTIAAITCLMVIGNVIHTAYKENIVRQEENAAKNTFLEWLHTVKPESIEEWGAQDTRTGKESRDFIEIELKDEQKEELCQALMAITVKDVVVGPGNPKEKDLYIWFYGALGSCAFKYDGATVYVTEVPKTVSDVVGLWPFEIRNEKFNEFLSGLLEQ